MDQDSPRTGDEHSEDHAHSEHHEHVHIDIPDDELPEDLRPEDNPLAVGLPPGESVPGLLEEGKHAFEDEEPDDEDAGEHHRA